MSEPPILNKLLLFSFLLPIISVLSTLISTLTGDGLFLVLFIFILEAFVATVLFLSRYKSASKSNMLRFLLFINTSLYLPTIMTKDAILGGDLGREMFLANLLKNIGNTELINIDDQVLYTGYTFFIAVFRATTEVNALLAVYGMYMVYCVLMTVLLHIILSKLTNVNNTTIALFTTLSMSQYLFLYASQQSLRTTGWISILLIIILASLLDDRMEKFLVMSTLFIGLAIHYYAYSYLLALFLPLIMALYFSIIRSNNMRIWYAISMTFVISTVLWNLFSSSVFGTIISAAIRNFIRSINEISVAHPQEASYIEAFEQTVSFKAITLLNIAFIVTIYITVLVAVINILKNKQEDSPLIFWLTFWSGIITLMGFSSPVRLTLGLNRVIGISVLLSLLYISKLMPSLNRAWQRLIGILFLVLLFSTITINTGVFQYILNDHENGFTYIDLNSRRYLEWSVPVYDLTGYEFLVVYGEHTHLYINVLTHTYADNIYFLYFSLKPHIYNVTYLALRSSEATNIAILRCVNVKTSTILKRGEFLGIERPLNLTDLFLHNNKLYDNKCFIIVEHHD